MTDDQDRLWGEEPPAWDEPGRGRTRSNREDEMPWPVSRRRDDTGEPGDAHETGAAWAPIERGGAAVWYAEQATRQEAPLTHGSGRGRGRVRNGGGGGGREARKRRARRRLVLVVALALVVVLVIGAVSIVRSYFSTGPVGEPVSVTIPSGATLNEIAEILADRGVVKHARLFVFKAQGDGYADKFRPGKYRLRVNEPYESLVALLLKGTAPPTVDVTIPEGLTIEEQAAKIKAALPGFRADEYVRIATKDPPSVEVEGYKQGTTLEGLLFPATYNVRKTIKPSAFIKLQLDALEENLAKVDMTRARQANLTEYDVLTIGSLVEGEALVGEERPLVAAVIWNRLREGMLLQIDAAIQYALGEQKPALTYDDYKIDSPYNVYKYFGLTPTPIGSPGLAAMQAAADPAAVDYLYYVARADGSGKHYWSNNYDQFLRDKAKAGQNAQE